MNLEFQMNLNQFLPHSLAEARKVSLKEMRKTSSLLCSRQNTCACPRLNDGKLVCQREKTNVAEGV